MGLKDEDEGGFRRSLGFQHAHFHRTNKFDGSIIVESQPKHKPGLIGCLEKLPWLLSRKRSKFLWQVRPVACQEGFWSWLGYV